MTVEIHQDDFRNVLASMADGSIDCVIADPPYGQTSLKWDRWIPGWPTPLVKKVKPTGSMWVFGSMRMFMEHASEFEGWKLSHDIVWEKHNGSSFHNDRFRRVHEHALHFYRADSPWSGVYRKAQHTHDAVAKTVRRMARPAQWTGATGPTVYRSFDGGPKLMRSVLFHRSEHGRALHPTQKPLSLVDVLVRYACPAGGLVFDPFAGAGTTGIAAKLVGADAVLCEVRPEYAETARRRIQDDAPLLEGLS